MMNFSDISSIVGAVLLSIGGGAVIVLGLSKWLGGVWASRILENEKADLQLHANLLTRRRDVYVKLATALRVFLDGSSHRTAENKIKFVEAYDEAFLWATEEVVESIGAFLDQQIQHAKAPGSVPQSSMNDAYRRCLVALRKDAGFPDSKTEYRIASFP